MFCGLLALGLEPPADGVQLRWMAIIYALTHLRRSLIYGAQFYDASLTHLSNLSWLLVESQSTRRQFRHCCTEVVERRP
jgi:hypothetical protein